MQLESLIEERIREFQNLPQTEVTTEQFIKQSIQLAYEAGVNEWYKDEEYKRGFEAGFKEKEDGYVSGILVGLEHAKKKIAEFYNGEEVGPLAIFKRIIDQEIAHTTSHAPQRTKAKYRTL